MCFARFLNLENIFISYIKDNDTERAGLKIKMFLNEEYMNYRGKHPRCRFCSEYCYSRKGEKCMLKDAKILPRFIQPISCRLCAYYKVEKTYSI